MPHISQMKESKFLRKEDCGPKGILVTIRDVAQENVAKEGAPEELKWCIWFNEYEKPMVLNQTNNQIIAAIAGSELTEDWTGHQIVLYHDPNISYAGKLVGGIRARAPKQRAAAAPPPAARPAPPPPATPPRPPLPEEEDDPF